MKPHTAIVHHSASPCSTTLEQIRQWHKAKGWEDVGYHYIIEGNGRRRYGRKIWTQGAHDQGQNHDTIGICVVGNNLDPAERWSLSQTLELVHCMKDLRGVYGPGFGFEMHCDNEPPETPTQCPGLSDVAWFQILEVVG